MAIPSKRIDLRLHFWYQRIWMSSSIAHDSDSCYLYPQALYSARGSPYPDILAQLTAGQPYLELSFIDFMVRLSFGIVYNFRPVLIAMEEPRLTLRYRCQTTTISMEVRM